MTAEHVYSESNYKFWWFQLLGWFGLATVTFLSITAWADDIELAHVAHTLLQSFLGLIISTPLRSIYDRIWPLSIVRRFAISAVMVIFSSALWTAIRLETFMWMSCERGLWSDFGEWYFASFFVFLCWTALYYSSKYYLLQQFEHDQLLAAGAHARKEQIKRFRAEAAAKEAELKMLRYQLNPHFLFNTLNAIKALVVLDDGAKAQKMIQHLSEFLRYSLDNDSVDEVTLAQEVEALMLYLDIEKTRFGTRLKLDFDLCDDSLPALLPGLILQPLIENSLKYAIAPSEGGGTIRVASTIREGQLHLELSDTGPGFQGVDLVSKMSSGRGVGLRNTLERLEIHYDHNYSFDVSDNVPSGVIISITIPLTFSEKNAQTTTYMDA